MKYPIRHPNGQEFGPYSVEELRQQSADKAYPANTEVFVNGEWVSLGGWLVVQRRVEQLKANEAFHPRVGPARDTATPPQPGSPQNKKAVLIGALLFLVVISLAFFLR